MSFLSGLGSFFSKLGSGLAKGIGIASQFEPEIALIPGVGPAIVTAIQYAAGLEQMFPQSGLGAQKSALAVPALRRDFPQITEAQAQAILNSVVGALNKEAAATPTP